MREEKVPILLEEGVELPLYASEEAAGADVCAHLEEEVIIAPGERRLIPTGLRLEIPKGYEVQVRPRSGLAFKEGITVVNTPGTIDSDYRGEIQVLLINHGSAPFRVRRGMRIAQLILAPVCRARFCVVEGVEMTKRGEGGFGHTGTD